MLLCYVTDRSQFRGDEASRRKRLLEKIGEAVECGVDMIQLREKDLSARDLELLASEVMPLVRKNPGCKLLINSRVDVAIATGADGVHLRSDDIAPPEVRAAWKHSNGERARLLIGVSCHSPQEVAVAMAGQADFAVFGPIFGKKGAPGVSPSGLDALHQACQHRIPVLALGGITLETAERCFEVGAAGIAGIRLFQENDICPVVEKLRALDSH